MIIVKVLLILIWIAGAVVLFILLPNAQVEQWVQTRLGSLKKAKPSKKPIDNDVKQVDVVENTVVPPPVIVEEEKEVEKEEEVDFADVEIFSKSLNVRQGFYPSLTPSQKQLFDELYVLDHPSHLVKTLQFNPNGDNQLFFKFVFNSLYTYRKLMSSDLLKVLTEEMLDLAEGNPQTQTILYEIATRMAYFRRKDPAFLAYAHSLAELDVTLNRSTLKRKDQYVYSYTRLAIILEKKKLFKEALAIVDEALQLNLNDKTVQGYQGRKTRILDKMRKVA
jgi:tetratricopeptide (TPR) repeat protein